MTCPKCKSENVHYWHIGKKREIGYNCHNCGYKFTVREGVMQ
jgi:transposase-like protein